MPSPKVIPNITVFSLAPSSATGERAGTGMTFRSILPSWRDTEQTENTGLVVTFDIGDTTNIHPPNKIEAGQRLAEWPLQAVYQTKEAQPTSPTALEVVFAENEVSVCFPPATGLMVGRKVPLEAPEPVDDPVPMVELRTATGNWVPARAEIDGSDTLHAFFPSAGIPTGIRYGWVNMPPDNLFLYTRTGAPCSPFEATNPNMPPLSQEDSSSQNVMCLTSCGGKSVD